MKRLGRIVAITGGMLVALVAVLFSWLVFTSVSAADLPPLKDGDIVFQYSGSSQSLPILLASRSAYTHMGIIDISRNGKPMVIEATGPVKSTPLDAWIAQGTGGRITVKRVRSIESGQALSILGEADKYLGLPYDLFFLDGKDAIYCSELVHLAFGGGAGIMLGEVQRVGDLDIDYAPVRKLIEARWQKHPMCRDGKKSTFEACYQTILQQTLVTPASIARDAKLEMVYSNFGAVTE